MKKSKLFKLVAVAMMSISLFVPNTLAVDVSCTALGDTVVIDSSIVDLVHLVIRIIQIAVPIILVIFGMFDLVKAMMSQKEDEIKKGQQIFIKRVLAAVLVFFVIAIVKFVISAVAGNTSNELIDCINCFVEGSDSAYCPKG